MNDSKTNMVNYIARDDQSSSSSRTGKIQKLPEHSPIQMEWDNVSREEMQRYWDFIANLPSHSDDSIGSSLPDISTNSNQFELELSINHNSIDDISSLEEIESPNSSTEDNDNNDMDNEESVKAEEEESEGVNNEIIDDIQSQVLLNCNSCDSNSISCNDQLVCWSLTLYRSFYAVRIYNSYQCFDTIM